MSGLAATAHPFPPPTSRQHSLPSSSFPSSLKTFSAGTVPQQERVSARSFRCYSSTTPGGAPRSGDDDSKAVLDAFFLGKAFAEALNERVVSAAGELLSVVGQWQAEQQKQARDFQDEVLERAKKAKAKAASEAVDLQGLIPKSTTSSDQGNR